MDGGGNDAQNSTGELGRPAEQDSQQDQRAERFLVDVKSLMRWSKLNDRIICYIVWASPVHKVR